jgi:hypothetical protein
MRVLVNLLFRAVSTSIPMKNVSLASALALVCMANAGCGGGSGGSGGGSLPATDSERSTVAQSVAGSSGSNLLGPVSLLNLTKNESASAAHSQASMRLPFVIAFTRDSLPVERQAGSGSQLSYTSVLGLYYSSTASSDGLTKTNNYFLDSAGTQPDGSTQSVKSSLNYPRTSTFTGTIPDVPSIGGGKVTANASETENDSSDSSGSLSGSLTAGSNAISGLSFTWTTDAQGNETITGGYSVTTSIGTVTYSNMQINEMQGNTAGGVTISTKFAVGGYTGSLTYNADGSGNETLTDPAGMTSTVTWTSSGLATLKAPDGNTSTFTI